MYDSLDREQKAWVDRVFAQMDERQKLGQLVCERGHYLREEVGNPAGWLKEYPVGFLFVGSEVIQLQSENIGDVNRVTEYANGTDRVPVVYCGDFERGIGDGIAGYTLLPRLMALSAGFSEKDAYEYGRIIGEEGNQLNIRWAFGPVSDLNVNRDNPVTNVRCAGDNPDHAIKILSNIVRGMQEQGCAAAPKHFPGDGSDTRNQHYVTSLNLLSKEEWDRYHGRVFKTLIDQGAMSLMIGHIGFPAVEEMDPVRGKFRPATCSKRLMTDLLRGELGFKGIILTDALCMCGYASWADYEQRTLDSFNGGVDVFLWPETERFFELMTRAFADGRASRERLDDSVKRVLAFKAKLGVHREHKVLEKEKLEAKLKQNRDLALKMADKGATLLRNRKNLIPLKLKKNAKVLVMVTPEAPGPMNGAVAFQNELKRRGFDVTYAPFSQFNAVKSVVESFDAVFLVCNAQPIYSDYRGFNFALWDFMANRDMDRWIIVSTGSPYYLYDVASAETYINVYSDSTVSIIAAVEAIFGEKPFLGRSPVGVEHCFRFGDGIITG